VSTTTSAVHLGAVYYVVVCYVCCWYYRRLEGATQKIARRVGLVVSCSSVSFFV